MYLKIVLENEFEKVTGYHLEIRYTKFDLNKKRRFPDLERNITLHWRIL
jgi:hypothetical protein